MTLETLKKGKELEVQINTLMSHIDDINTVGGVDAKYVPTKNNNGHLIEPTINVVPANGNLSRVLIPSLLPMPIDTFVKMYLYNANEKLEQLKLELANLS